MPSQPPSSPVLHSFGAAGLPLVPLAGGQGTSWLAGDLVLKPLDLDERELAWQAGVFAAICCDGFRVARSRRAADGSLCVQGWCAWERVAGQHQRGRWPEVIAVGERFHSALAGLPRPDFLDLRTSPWAISDRVAWGEIPADRFSRVPHLARLAAALRPVAAPSQLIHGDLSENILFADPLPPAVIDFSPYWRPAAFASAIVIADALVFDGAGEQVLQAAGHIEMFGQFLVRALIFRAVAAWLLRRDDLVRPDGTEAWSPAVELACRLASGP